MSGKIGRGTLAALAIVIWIALTGSIDDLAGWSLRSPFATAALVMMILGAFLSSLPGRILRRNTLPQRTTWRRCPLCLLGGVVLMLGLGLAGCGDGQMLAGLSQGSVSAYAFALISGASCFISAHITERRTPS